MIVTVAIMISVFGWMGYVIYKQVKKTEE